MKKLLMATAASAIMATGAQAEDIKLGVLLAFTGPLESLAPAIADGAELAIEFGGRYDVERIREFHRDCVARRRPYELW